MATLDEALVALTEARDGIFAVEARVEAACDSLFELIEALNASQASPEIVDQLMTIATDLKGKVVEFDEDIVPAS